MLIPLIIFLIGLVGMLGLVPVFSLLFDRRTNNRAARRLIGFAIPFGYFAGGILVWSFALPHWRMSFWETLAASVDASTYGRPTEHYAESILVMMLCACVAGALISGVIAATTARLLKPRQEA
jgi:hypothetical protein